MSIEGIAEIYVDYIEPAFKLGAFLVLVVVVLHVLNMIRHGGNSSSLVSRSYALLIVWGVALCGILKRVGIQFGKISAVYISALIATVRDFLQHKN